MADGQQTATMVILGVYLILIYLFGYLYVDAFGTDGVALGVSPSLANTLTCEEPRYSDAGRSDVNHFSESSLKCKDIMDKTPDFCESIPNCDWNETSSFFWWLGVESTHDCVGTVSLAYLAPNNVTVDNVSVSQNLYREVVRSNGQGVQLGLLPTLANAPSLCASFGFTPSTAGAVEYDKKKSITSLFGQLVDAFALVTGASVLVDEDGSVLMAVLMFIMFTIPLIWFFTLLVAHIPFT